MTDPTSRALALLGLLESRATWPGPELAERLGVTTRTLRRDVDRLRSLGYRVEAEAGAAGGYALGRGQVVPPLLLDEDEVLATVLALLTTAADGSAGDSTATLRALGKLEDVMPSALRHQARELRRRVQLSPSLAEAPDPVVLSRVAEATRRHQRIRFAYRSRHDERSQRHVEPHQLVARERRWYLFGHDLDRDDWRTFRLDRMEDVERTSWEFRPRPDLAQALARAGQGMPASAYRHRVDVVVHAPRDEVAAQLPHAAGVLTAMDDGSTRLETGADDAALAAWWLARLPFGFRVVGDQAVREAVVALAGRLAGAVGEGGVPAGAAGD